MTTIWPVAIVSVLLLCAPVSGAPSGQEDPSAAPGTPKPGEKGTAPAAGVPDGGQAAAANPFRLSRDVEPSFTEVRLVLDPRQAGYTGTVTIDLAVHKAVDSFRLNARDIDFKKITLEGPAGRLLLESDPPDGDMVTLRAPRTISTGNHKLQIDFAARFGTRATGLYRLETGGESYAFTQFEAVDARAAFPCWDEPSFKHPWQIIVRIPEGDRAFSNTPVDFEGALEGDEEGWKTVAFKKTPPLPSYLLALAIGPLETVPIEGMSVPGNVVTVKGQSKLAREAARLAPPILGWLESYFGRPYPFEKLDLIAVPEFWPGAMENAGAITFADRILLVDPDAATATERNNIVRVAAHEMAHMWFGDLVTMDWWDDLWLNESFATWMGTKCTEALHPEYGDLDSELRSIDRAMIIDGRLTSRAIRQPVDNMANLLQSADILAYNKGHGVLRMFELWMGEETFQKGIRDYLESNAGGNATASDLWGALSKASGRDVTGAMETFLDQPGVPIVKVDLLPGGRVRLAQSRFLSYGVEPPAAQTWRIPVSLKFPTQTGPQIYSFLMTEPEQTVSLPIGKTPEWVYPNAGASGYYRWSLPSRALSAMMDDASAGLTTQERIALPGSLGALLDAGVVGGPEYMNALKRLGSDPDPQVVAAVVAGVRKVKESFVTPGLDEAYATWVRKTLRPALDRIGMAPQSGEDEEISMLRPTVLEMLGDDGSDEEVLRVATREAASYLRDPSSVDPSLAGTVLSLAALDGNADLYTLYRQRFEKATVPADRMRYRTALGAFRDRALAEKTLRYSLEGPLRPQEVLRILMPLEQREQMRDLVFDWIMKNYDQILTRIPKEAAAFIPHLAGGCSEQRAARAKAFFSGKADAYPGTEKEVAKMAESVRDCASLRRREGAAVAEYLRNDARATAEGGE
ncbi:MAG TPA: M1 family metallopeptidase [Candidatus Saccharimonadales bacterium]|nr:M1 family metallopeptidase [Candidatus Saccharimonadales bacterium]